MRIFELASWMKILGPITILIGTHGKFLSLNLCSVKKSLRVYHGNFMLAFKYESYGSILESGL